MGHCELGLCCENINMDKYFFLPYYNDRLKFIKKRVEGKNGRKTGKGSEQKTGI